MPTPIVVAVFLSVVLGLAVGTHLYLFHHLARLPNWPRRTRRGLAWMIAGLGLMIPLAMVGVRTLPRELAQPLAWVSYVWLGMLYFFMVLFGLFDAGRIVRRLLPIRKPDPSPSRRVFLHRTAAATVTGTTGVISALALRNGLGDTEVRELGVRLERLPKTLSGLTLVQLSDIHIGPILGEPFMSYIVERANALRPDIVVITGDLVDGSVEELMPHVAPLARLRSRYGTYFVTGNHEYYSGAAAWSAALSQLGITVLHNRHVQVGDDGGTIDLLGIDDWSVYRSRADLIGQPMASQLRPDRERILLAHQPRAIGEAERLDAGLQLSGHTHGGQLFPTAAAVKLTTPYVAGLYQHDARTQIYVSRGTGFWGPPMRFLAPAEITKIVLS